MDYKEAKIYAIRSYQTDKIYIGSTCQPLYKRFYQHKKMNDTSSKEILDLNDAYIELLENFPCSNRDELKKREGELIRDNNSVNKNVAGRNRCQWYKDNKKTILEKQHERYNKIHNII
jgi:hypothetical protein